MGLTQVSNHKESCCGGVYHMIVIQACCMTDWQVDHVLSTGLAENVTSDFSVLSGLQTMLKGFSKYRHAILSLEKK